MTEISLKGLIDGCSHWNNWWQLLMLPPLMDSTNLTTRFCQTILSFFLPQINFYLNKRFEFMVHSHVRFITRLRLWLPLSLRLGRAPIFTIVIPIPIHTTEKNRNRTRIRNLVTNRGCERTLSLWKPCRLLLVFNRNRLCNISSTYDTWREISSLGNVNTKLGTTPRRFHSTSYLYRHTV